MNNLLNISPLDGRYQNQTKELSAYFSEAALMRYRLVVEVEYFVSLSLEENIKELKPFSRIQENHLRSFYKKFSLQDAQEIKKIENTTNHDVKAVEYFLKQKLSTSSLKNKVEFIHFGLTSEDINNLSYGLMLKMAIHKEIIPVLEQLLDNIKTLAKKYQDISLLSLTHGQAATPTTIGKELAVFYARLNNQIQNLKQIRLTGKLNGASGNYAAAHIAYPEVDWINFSNKFINKLGLKSNLLTTQIEPHDNSARLFDALARINNIIRDLDQDMWLYISRKIFKLKKKEGEVGSSTMPHKVNPIDFENSEGNLGLANSILRFLADKLTVSRLQRDLSDSTVIRNQGLALGYGLLAYKSCNKGLNKIEVNTKIVQQELGNHWEVLSEAIQTILRKVGYNQPYEKLKELTRGEKINEQTIKKFIKTLDIDVEEKKKLFDLTPQTYIGLSKKLSGEILK